MDSLKLMVSIFVLGAIFVLGYYVMTFGWGLEVKSWPWIVGGYLGSVFLHLFNQALKED